MTVVAFPTSARVVARIIWALREGFGVEDMEAQGIASADEARCMIAALRETGVLPRVIGVPE